jgi:hypothetical protein
MRAAAIDSDHEARYSLTPAGRAFLGRASRKGNARRTLRRFVRALKTARDDGGPR